MQPNTGIQINILTTGLFIGYQHEEVWPFVQMIIERVQKKSVKKKETSTKR